MCVIMIVTDDKKRPTDGMVQAGWESNSYGGGVGWVQRGTPNVAKWMKGIDSYQKMQEFAKELPVPYVLHFRIPSVGAGSKDLTHPFPVEGDVSVELEGESQEGLLFHNGTWSQWRDRLLHFVCGTGTGVPDGPWSDSRAMAFLAHHLGLNFLELIDEKICVLLPDTGNSVPDTYMYGTWIYEFGIHFSNMHWRHRSAFMAEERRLLPGTTTSGHSSSNPGAGGYFTQPPASMVRQHDVSCQCVQCQVDDTIRRRGASNTADPTTGSATTPQNPAPTDQELSAAGHITLGKIKEEYSKLSKKALKRLRKKMLYKPQAVSLMEEKVLMYASIQDKRKIQEKYGNAIH
jgi:hypothetical protein